MHGNMGGQRKDWLENGMWRAKLVKNARDGVANSKSSPPGKMMLRGGPRYEATTNSGTARNNALFGVFIGMMTWLRWSKTRVDIASEQKWETQRKENKKKKGRTGNDGYSRAVGLSEMVKAFLILFWTRNSLLVFFLLQFILVLPELDAC
jgi:hypothetical protein